MTSPKATPAAVGRSLLPLIAWTELRMAVRGGLFRFVALLMFLVGWSVGNVGGRGVAMSAYATGQTACLYLGVMVALWVSLGAVRDTALRTETLIFTKPQPPERLAFARFLGVYGQILCFLVALFLGAMVGRWFAEGNLFGFPAYGVQYLRAAGVLFFAACAGYCLALLADSPVAGAIVGVYWIVVMAGREFLSKAYFPWYSQNIPAYLCLGLALLCLALWFSRRRLRGGVPAAAWVRFVAPASALLGGWLLWGTIRDGHDPMAKTNASLERVGEQTIRPDDLTPGFLLPDQKGRPTALSQFPGRILIIALWSPGDIDSTLLLARMDEVYRKHGAQGVLPVAVCLSEDAGAATTFAYGERLDFPVVYDWGTHNASQKMEISPTALAYRAERLPRVIITDRRHRVRHILDGLSAYEGSEFESAIRKRLEQEPEL